MPTRGATLAAGTILSAWAYVFAQVEQAADPRPPAPQQQQQPAPGQGSSYVGWASLAALALNLVGQFRNDEVRRLRDQLAENRQQIAENKRRLDEADTRAESLEEQRDRLSRENLAKTEECLRISRELTQAQLREIPIAHGFLRPSDPTAAAPEAPSP